MCDHGFAYGYTWTKLQLQRAGLVKPAKRRGVHRRRRPRRPLPGMLVFQDASPFRWLAALDRELDLVASMDDATSEVYSAFLVEEESTHSSFRGLQETIEAKGLFEPPRVYRRVSRTRFPWTQNWLNRSVQGGPEHDR